MSSKRKNASLAPATATSTTTTDDSVMTGGNATPLGEGASMALHSMARGLKRMKGDDELVEEKAFDDAKRAAAAPFTISDIDDALASVPTTKTANGASSYETTSSHRLDLFFGGLTRGADPLKVQRMVARSWNEGPNGARHTLQILLHARDCRGGKGEKATVLAGLLWLRQHKPLTYTANLQRFIDVGYYKDLLQIAAMLQSNSLHASSIPTTNDSQKKKKKLKKLAARADANAAAAATAVDVSQPLPPTPTTPPTDANIAAAVTTATSNGARTWASLFPVTTPAPVAPVVPAATATAAPLFRRGGGGGGGGGRGAGRGGRGRGGRGGGTRAGQASSLSYHHVITDDDNDTKDASDTTSNGSSTCVDGVIRRTPSYQLLGKKDLLEVEMFAEQLTRDKASFDEYERKLTEWQRQRNTFQAGNHSVTLTKAPLKRNRVVFDGNGNVTTASTTSTSATTTASTTATEAEATSSLCYNCGRKGHWARDCPDNINDATTAKVDERDDGEEPINHSNGDELSSDGKIEVNGNGNSKGEGKKGNKNDGPPRPKLSLTLAAKWAPTEKNSFDRKASLAKRMAILLYPPNAPLSATNASSSSSSSSTSKVISALGAAVNADVVSSSSSNGDDMKSVDDVDEADSRDRAEKNGKIRALMMYRKTLTSLRKHLRVVESLMCAGDWHRIDFAGVPSRAHHALKSAFRRHQPDRYASYLEDVASGKKTIKTQGVQPHELVQLYYSNPRRAPEDTTEAMWTTMIAKLRAKGRLHRALALSDVSGSMEGIPMMVSIALGLIVSSLAPAESPFYRQVMTFDTTPTLHRIPDDCHTLCAQVASLRSAPWGGSTSLERAFQLILDTARNNNLPPDQLPRTLFIFSDMQFDQAAGNGGSGWTRTLYDTMADAYRQAGYQLPQVVFWNLRGDTVDFPVYKDTPNVALVSGFSKDLLELFMDGEEGMSPMGILMHAICEYECTVIESEK
jgi:hypothetical protein